MLIYCCSCGEEVEARLTDGEEIYPHRKDLYHLPFWKCDTCDNYVGCHHKTNNPTRPLGAIPSPEIKNARKHIHSVLDPLWKEKKMRRGDLYRKISAELGYEYHTGELVDIEEARKVYKIVNKIRMNL